MKNDIRRILFIDRKLKQLCKNNNKSLLETNKTSISNGIKNSFDNNNINFAKKIMNRNLMVKYNVTPFKHTLISIQNFIESKYCREIAVFKENLIFNYGQEFLKRMYNKNESITRLPKFVVYYRNYLLFFCRPIFHELKLDEKFQKYYETKAQLFYQGNYNKENKKEKNTNNENVITIFTPKIKQILSGQNSSSHLTIKKVDSNSVITVLSLENSILKMLNENNNKQKENKKKQRTPTDSIRRNTISSRKNNHPKLFSNLFIPTKTESNNNNTNYFKTSSNFNTLKNEHLRTKLNLKKSKILSNIYFNQGKNVYTFKKLIIKYNI